MRISVKENIELLLFKQKIMFREIGEKYFAGLWCDDETEKVWNEIVVYANKNYQVEVIENPEDFKYAIKKLIISEKKGVD